jgi:hypothetical protein
MNFASDSQEIILQDIFEEAKMAELDSVLNKLGRRMRWHNIIIYSKWMTERKTKEMMEKAILIF